MSFENLKQAILDEANLRISTIRNQHDKQMRHERIRIKNRAQKLEEETLEAAKLYGDREARRLRQSHQLESKANILRKKQDELDETQRVFTQELLNQDEKEIEKLLVALLDFLPNKKGRLVTGSLHTNLIKKLNKNSKITISKKTISNDGGFIFKATDSELNLTIGFLVKQLFEKNRTDFAHLLFK